MKEFTAKKGDIIKTVNSSTLEVCDAEVISCGNKVMKLKYPRYNDDVRLTFVNNGRKEDTAMHSDVYCHAEELEDIILLTERKKVANKRK